MNQSGDLLSKLNSSKFDVASKRDLYKRRNLIYKSSRQIYYFTFYCYIIGEIQRLVPETCHPNLPFSAGIKCTFVKEENWFLKEENWFLTLPAMTGLTVVAPRPQSALQSLPSTTGGYHEE